jgi:hypothetical protein
MSVVPTFVPLALHAGRPLLSGPAVATVMMMVVGFSGDPIFVAIAAMVSIEGSAALLALILPALAGDSCNTMVSPLTGPTITYLCETHYALRHPSSSEITTDQASFAGDALSRGGVGVALWVLTRLSIYFAATLAGYLLTYLHARRAQQYRATTQHTIAAFVATQPELAGNISNTVGPRPTCDLWFNTPIFNCFFPMTTDQAGLIDAPNSQCAQTGAPPPAQGKLHSKPGMLWLFVWFIGWLSIALLIESCIPIYDSTAYASGFNSTYHITFMTIIAMFGPYFLHSIFRMANDNALPHRPDQTVDDGRASVIANAQWDGYDRESTSAYLFLVFVPTFVYVISTIGAVLVANKWILRVNYAASWDIVRRARQSLEIVELISTIGAVAVGICVIVLLYYVGMNQSNHVDTLRKENKVKKNLYGHAANI